MIESTRRGGGEGPVVAQHSPQHMDAGLDSEGRVRGQLLAAVPGGTPPKLLRPCGHRLARASFILVAP